MLKAYLNEFKSIFKQSKFHVLRYIGILFIPFVYGFFYIFAFWNPFEKINNIPVAIVTQKNAKQYDHFSEALGKILNKNQNVDLGDIKVNFKATHIYADVSTEEKYQAFVKENKDKYHAIIAIPSLDDTLEKLITSKSTGSRLNLLTSLIETIANLNSNNSNGLIRIFNNYKRNYIISFGLDVAENSSSKNALIVKILSQIFKDQNYRQYLLSKNITQNSIDNITNTLNNFNSILNSKDTFKLIHLKTQMHQHAKYGFGLAPFFISIAIWVGLMAATFVIHPRIYNQKQKHFRNYFAKYLALMTTSFLQSIILLISFIAIGFYQLDIGNIFLILFSMFFGGFIFTAIIQFIRWAAPTKLLGILFIIVLLILQMASNGGLFPIKLQSTFYKVLNIGLPASKLVELIRESMFQTSLDVFFKQIGFLLIYPAIFIPLGLFVNKLKTPKWQKLSLELDDKFALKGGRHV